MLQIDASNNLTQSLSKLLFLGALLLCYSSIFTTDQHAYVPKYFEKFLQTPNAPSSTLPTSFFKDEYGNAYCVVSFKTFREKFTLHYQDFSDGRSYNYNPASMNKQFSRKNLELYREKLNKLLSANVLNKDHETRFIKRQAEQRKILSDRFEVVNGAEEYVYSDNMTEKDKTTAREIIGCFGVFARQVLDAEQPSPNRVDSHIS